MIASWQVLEGDARAVLTTLPAESVHCCVTSPPYWNLRDYGVEGQIGLEKTPEEFLARLVDVFAGVRRVLHPRGTCWVNMGDSYAGGGRGGGGTFMSERGDSSWRKQAACNGWSAPPAGLKPKDLLMLPARLALALQADGWWLRSEICWAKERPMPEAVIDRPTKAHEMIYLLTKSEHYAYDGYAVREPVSGGAKPRGAGTTRKGARAGRGVKANPSFAWGTRHAAATRNARDVWTFDASPLRDEEFYAAFPEELARRCILAGSSEHGVCSACLAPWARIVERQRLLDGEPYENPPPARNTSKATPSSASGVSHARVTVSMKHIGWKAGCTCGAERRPSIVLDPFTGSGTTGIVARTLGRHFVGVELNPTSAAMARRRIEQDAPLFNRPSEATA